MGHSYQISLAAAKTLNFKVSDGAGWYFDNSGGVSLNLVSTVPLPPAAWLFGSGLLGLVGYKRKTA